MIVDRELAHIVYISNNFSRSYIHTKHKSAISYLFMGVYRI
ncbi:hypothetical protein CAXC1_200011 [Candidatus Xenohaliotis californiensis]|uniref:Uncharacterized protein n=1 Tax=Candidatus Xenohaliotis californiensis TaxID=84677 RepID=A0ABM9N7M8_9RICK|nr:hypothetical protein CAXC1_200011 [Candidatus Xenohaliotis californiensis]